MLVWMTFLDRKSQVQPSITGKPPSREGIATSASKKERDQSPSSKKVIQTSTFAYNGLNTYFINKQDKNRSSRQPPVDSKTVSGLPKPSNAFANLPTKTQSSTIANRSSQKDFVSPRKQPKQQVAVARNLKNSFVQQPQEPKNPQTLK